jgi:hypothetical protein
MTLNADLADVTVTHFMILSKDYSAKDGGKVSKNAARITNRCEEQTDQSR